MPYQFTQAVNSLKVEERQYSSASEIRFTAFTSCIGIVSVNVNMKKVIGIHLSLRDQNNAIAVSDIPEAIGKLHVMDYKKSNTIIIGEISAWRRSAPAVYNTLLLRLGRPTEYDWASGVYGATFSKDAEVNGNIEFTFF